jgi:hypothetical protein
MIAASLLLRAGRPLPAHLQTMRLKVLALLLRASPGPLAIVGGGAGVVFGEIIARKTEEHLQAVASDHVVSEQAMAAFERAFLAGNFEAMNPRRTRPAG